MGNAFFTLMTAIGLILMLSTSHVMAQSRPYQSFWDTYFPVAKLFDSPVFFGVVVGSGLLFFGASIVFMWKMKRKFKLVEEWASQKEVPELIDLLDSPSAEEARMAFMYLRKHGDEKAGGLIVQKMQAQRKEGRINPFLIYLAEDIGISSAVDVLKAIAKGKSKSARLAQSTLNRFGVNSTEAQVK